MMQNNIRQKAMADVPSLPKIVSSGTTQSLAPTIFVERQRMRQTKSRRQQNSTDLKQMHKSNKQMFNVYAPVYVHKALHQGKRRPMLLQSLSKITNPTKQKPEVVAFKH